MVALLHRDPDMDEEKLALLKEQWLAGQASRTETSEAYDSGMVILSYQPQPRA